LPRARTVVNQKLARPFSITKGAVFYSPLLRERERERREETEREREFGAAENYNLFLLD
jgi:hypothetical protein